MYKDRKIVLHTFLIYSKARPAAMYGFTCPHKLRCNTPAPDAFRAAGAGVFRFVLERAESRAYRTFKKLTFSFSRICSSWRWAFLQAAR